MIRMMGLVDLRAIGAPIGSRTTTYESLGLPTSDTIGKEDGKIKPSNDHEVSMANNSLDAIIRDANELKTKLGTEEKDIPAWIQNHITNAENFISQAANNYHELNTPDTASPPQDADPLSEEAEMVTNPKTGKQIKASSALSPDHPAYAAAKRLLQGKKLSAGQRRGLKKMASAALSKARPTKGPAKMKKSEKTSSQSAHKQQRGREREGAKSDTAYSVYGPDN